jgi:hypothetical protein
MSGFGAPARTAIPIPDLASGTRLEETMRPSLINSFKAASGNMMTSTGSPRRSRLGIDSSRIPVKVAKVTTFCDVVRSIAGMSSTYAAATPPEVITLTSWARAATTLSSSAATASSARKDMRTPADLTTLCVLMTAPSP